MQFKTKRLLFLWGIFILLFFLSCKKHGKTKSGQHEAAFYVTALDQSELLKSKPVKLITSEAENTATIRIDPSKKYQKMDGFGYTLTGGSAMLIQQMTPVARRKLLQELFGRKEKSIGISYLRVSIGASDLDPIIFSYDDLPKGETDVLLTHFSLANDTLNLIPTLKEILAISPDLKIMGSPWSAPVWMKTNDDTKGGSLQGKYGQAYADYFVKYIRAMANHGIKIDAITPQNEPLNPKNNPSMVMQPKEQLDFIKNHLGPLFKKENINTKIVIYDHNADRPDYPMTILQDSVAAKYIDGSAFHLYGGEIGALAKVHHAFPNKNLYFTEQWVGAPANFSNEMAWHTKNLIIGAPRNWCKTVLEWNLAADNNQEPHTDRGGCDRCLGAITIDGDEVTRNPAYYIIAQASRFVPPGSVRIASNRFKEIPNVAFLIPTGKTVLILQNDSNHQQKITINSEEKSYRVSLKEGEVGTLVF